MYLCPHNSFERTGIQRLDIGEIHLRVYLVTCRSCGKTFSTQTLRDMRGAIQTANAVGVQALVDFFTRPGERPPVRCSSGPALAETIGC